MSSLEANKIFGAVLGTVFVAFGASLVAEGIFHAEAPEKPGFEIIAAEPEAAGGGGAAAPEDPPVASLLQNANVETGAAEFRKCQACHSGEEGGPNKVGPHIWDVVNRPIASIADFNYSAAMKDFSQGGSVNWDYDHLYHFLKAPKGYISGTAMGFAGIKDPQGRADLIAYLRSLSSNPAPLPPPPAEGEATPAAAEAVTEPGTTTQQAPGAGAESQGQAPATTPATESNQGETESLAPRAPGAASPAAPGAAPAPTSTQTPGQQQGSAAPAAGGAVQTAAAGDATAGKAVFRKCQACHAVGPNATNKIGPELNGIFGEAPAAVEGYSFSPALKEYASKQPVWDDASMTAWLADPKKTVPGTKMAFPGLKNPKEIADVIAYLKSFDESGAGGQ